MAFTRGDHTFRVLMTLFKENRQRLCQALKASHNLNSGTYVFLEGGKEMSRYNTDTTEPPFRQESYFHWCFGVEEPDFYGAIEVESGKGILFMPKLHESYAIWQGKIHDGEHFRQKYEIDEVHFVDDIEKTLLNKKTQRLLFLKGQNTDSDMWIEPPKLESVKKFPGDTDILYHVISECRVFKSDLEIEVMRYVCKLSCDAHVKMMRSVRAGMYEYQMESIFKHHSYYHGGCRHMAYCCIGASGCNAAALHYGHAGAPNSRKMQDGDMCLFDMGAEYCCYSADITTSFPVNGKFSPKQKLIYNAVLHANRSVLKAAKPGVSWVDMHLLAQKVILEHLKAGGLLTGDVDDMMKENLGATFMPHGLGHFLGLDVHDVHGYPPGTKRLEKPSLRNLRTVRDLQPRMIITIEPGCYFIDTLLDQAFKNPTLSKFLIADKINQFRGFGGVRIEDDVLITETGTENLSPVPREIDEIEHLMAQGRTDG